MGKHTKYQDKKSFLHSLKRHTLLTAVFLFIIFVIVALGIAHYSQNSQELSFADLIKLSYKINDVYSSLPINDRASTKTCHFERPNFGQSLLYCSVESVGYVSTKTMSQETTVADFVNKVPLLGTISEKNLL